MTDEYSAAELARVKSSTNLPVRNFVPATISGPDLACVKSEDLIGKDREVMIKHSGVYYRLRITRANKLILTK
jgi:hemin uptake protein HemP